MKCEICFLDFDELYDCWFRVRDNFLGKPTGVIQRYNACRFCAKHSIAYEKYGEKVFEMAAEQEWSYQI